MKTAKVTHIACFKPGQVSRTKLAPIAFESIAGSDEQLATDLAKIGFSSQNTGSDKLKLLRFIFGHWDYNSEISRSNTEQLNAFKALIDKGVDFHSKYCAQDFDPNALPKNIVAVPSNEEENNDDEAKQDAPKITQKHQLIFHYLYRPGEKAAIESKVTALAAQTNNLIIALSAFMKVEDADKFVANYNPNSGNENAGQSEEENHGEENADNHNSLAKIVYALKLRDADAKTVTDFLNKIENTIVPEFTNLTQVNSYIDYVNNMVTQEPITYLDASGKIKNSNSDAGTPKKYYATILKGVLIPPDEMAAYQEYLREYSILKAIFSPRAVNAASVKRAQVAPQPQAEILSLGDDDSKKARIEEILKYLKENEIYSLAPRKTATYAKFKMALELAIKDEAEPFEALLPFTSNIYFSCAKDNKVATGQQSNLAVSINKYLVGVLLLANKYALKEAAKALNVEQISLKKSQTALEKTSDKDKEIKAQLAEDFSGQRTLAILKMLKAMAKPQEEKKKEGEAAQAQENATEAFNTFFSFLKLPVGLTLSNFSLKKDINGSTEVKTCHDQLADPSKPITKSALLGEDGKPGMLFSLLGNLNENFSIKILVLELQMPEFIARLKNTLDNKSVDKFIIALIREINRVKLMNYLDQNSTDEQKARIKAYGTGLTNENIRSIYNLPQQGSDLSNEEEKVEESPGLSGADASSEDPGIVINNFLRAAGEVSEITSDLAEKVGSFNVNEVINNFLGSLSGVKISNAKATAIYAAKMSIRAFSGKLGLNDSKYPKLFNSYASEDIDTLKEDPRYLGLKGVVTTELDEKKYKSANFADAAYHGWCYVVANEFKDLDLSVLKRCNNYKELWEQYIEPFNIAAQKFGPEKVKAFLNKNKAINTLTLISLAQQYQAAAKAGDTVKVGFISEIYNDLFKGSEILGNLKLDLLKNGLSVEQIQEFGDILKNPILKELVQVSAFTTFIKNKKDELLKEISRVEPSPHFYFLIATKGQQVKLEQIKVFKKQNGPLYEKMLSDIRIELDEFKNGKISHDHIESKLDEILQQESLSPELGEIDNAKIARFQKLATISALLAEDSKGYKLELDPEDKMKFNIIKNQLENAALKGIVKEYFDGDPKIVHAFNAITAQSESDSAAGLDQPEPSQAQGVVEVEESPSVVENQLMTAEQFKLINAIRALSDKEYWNRVQTANQDPKNKNKVEAGSVLERQEQMIKLKDLVLGKQFNLVNPNPEEGNQAEVINLLAGEKKDEEISNAANACAKLRCLKQIKQLSQKITASPENKLLKANLALQQSVLQVLNLQSSNEQVNKNALVEAKANVIACISAINCLVDKDHKMLNTQQIYALLDDACSNGNSLQKLPTGSGKTFVLAVKAVMHALLGEQVYYQVPTKELRTQGFDDFKALYDATSGLKAHVVRAGDKPEEFYEEGQGRIYLLTDTDIHFFLMDGSDSQKQAKSVLLADEMDKQYLQVKDYSECEILPQYSDDQERKDLFKTLLDPEAAVDLPKIPAQVKVLIQQAKQDLDQYIEDKDYFVDKKNKGIIRLLDGEVLSETADYISHFLAARHDCIPPRLFKKGKSSSRAVLSGMLSNCSRFGTSGTSDAAHILRVDGEPLPTTLWPEMAQSRRVVKQIRPGDDNLLGRLGQAKEKLFSPKVKGFTVKSFVQRFFKRSNENVSIFQRGGPNLIFAKDLKEANALLNELLEYAKAKKIPDLNSLKAEDSPLTILIYTGAKQEKYVLKSRFKNEEKVICDTLKADPVNGVKQTSTFTSHEYYFEKSELQDGKFRKEAGKQNVISIVTEDSGRGLDIHPEGEHGLTVCVTNALAVNEEQTQQIGRAGRQGAFGRVYKMFFGTHDRAKLALHDQSDKADLRAQLQDQAAKAGSVQERNAAIAAQQKQAITAAEQTYSDSMKAVLRGVVTQLTVYSNSLSSYEDNLTKIGKLKLKLKHKKNKLVEKETVAEAIKDTVALMASLTTKIGAIQALINKGLLTEEDKTAAITLIDSLELNGLQSIHNKFKEAIKKARTKATQGVEYNAQEEDLLEALYNKEKDLNGMRGKNLAARKINEGNRNKLKGEINDINEKISEIFKGKDDALIERIAEAKSQINSLKLDDVVVYFDSSSEDASTNYAQERADSQLSNKRTWPAIGAIFLASLAVVAFNLEYSGVFDYLNGVKPTFEFNELVLGVSLAVFLLIFIPAILGWSTRTNIRMQGAKHDSESDKLSNKLTWAKTFALVLVGVGAIAYNLKIDGVIDFLRGVEGAKLEVDGFALALSLLLIAVCVVIISSWNTRSRIKKANSASRVGDGAAAVPPAPSVAPKSPEAAKQPRVTQNDQSSAEPPALSGHGEGKQSP